jgi:hypothetical protein
LFLDGVGIGPADPALNPFLVARLPELTRLLGGVPTLDRPVATGERARAFPLDATLGTTGTPQSGTGQTSLLTGINAAELFGGHFGPWTPVALRPLLEERSVLRRAVDQGLPTAFANAYPRGWPGRESRLAAPPLAARGAGLLTRHEDALARGEAVASEILNTGWRLHLGHDFLPEVTAEQAGATLARIGGAHRLTFYAHYATDTAGHRGGMAGAVRALELLDAFLGGYVRAVPQDVVTLIASDHGNLEDVGGGHTRNPVLGALAGPATERRAGELGSILDVADAVMRWIDEG